MLATPPSQRPTMHFPTALQLQQATSPEGHVHHLLAPSSPVAQAPRLPQYDGPWSTIRKSLRDKQQSEGSEAAPPMPWQLHQPVASRPAQPVPTAQLLAPPSDGWAARLPQACPSRPAAHLPVQPTSPCIPGTSHDHPAARAQGAQHTAHAYGAEGDPVPLTDDGAAAARAPHRADELSIQSPAGRNGSHRDTGVGSTPSPAACESPAAQHGVDAVVEGQLTAVVEGTPSPTDLESQAEGHGKDTVVECTPSTDVSALRSEGASSPASQPLDPVNPGTEGPASQPIDSPQPGTDTAAPPVDTLQAPVAAERGTPLVFDLADSPDPSTGTRGSLRLRPATAGGVVLQEAARTSAAPSVPCSEPSPGPAGALQRARSGGHAAARSTLQRGVASAASAEHGGEQTAPGAPCNDLDALFPSAPPPGNRAARESATQRPAGSVEAPALHPAHDAASSCAAAAAAEASVEPPRPATVRPPAAAALASAPVTGTQAQREPLAVAKAAQPQARAPAAAKKPAPAVKSAAAALRVGRAKAPVPIEEFLDAAQRPSAGRAAGQVLVSAEAAAAGKAKGAKKAGGWRKRKPQQSVLVRPALTLAVQPHLLHR